MDIAACKVAGNCGLPLSMGPGPEGPGYVPSGIQPKSGPRSAGGQTWASAPNFGDQRSSANRFYCDPAGNIASRQVETSGATATMTSYSHNSLNQLTSIGGSAGANTVIVRGDTNEPATVEVKSGAAGSAWKDARMLSGNRFESDLDLAAGANAIDIRATDGSNNVANHTYSLTLAAAAAASPTYDADGNMTSDGVRGYEWDRMSRLVKVTWGGSPAKSTEYRYNALGQRSERIEKSGATETAHYYYLYEGIRLLCRYQGGTAATNIDRRYLAQGEQRKISSAWSSYYYNRDHLGSVREVMNADGSLAARYDYTPYGVRRVQYQSTAYTGGCDHGFTGHITQASAVPGQTELVLTHFRGYDPELGRWLSPDPIGEAGGINLYGYVRGNPVNLWDALGLFEIYSHSEGAAGHVGCSTKGSSGKLSWDFGRYAGKNPGFFNGLNPLGKGPNILKRTVGDSYAAKTESYQNISIPVSRRLEQEIEALFQSLFDAGKSVTPNGKKLPTGQKYMGSDWEPVNRNCNKFTFDTLDKFLKSKGTTEALDARRRLLAFSGMYPDEVNNKMEFYNMLE